MPDQEKQAAVPFFAFEGAITKMESAMEKMKESNQSAMEKMKESNQRMHSALCVVCATLAFVVITFVAGYTINNRNWIRYVEQLQNVAEEFNAGIYQQPDSGDHP